VIWDVLNPRNGQIEIREIAIPPISATEFPSILKLLIKKINITGNNPLTRQWWYDVMTSRPPPLPTKEENNREIILDRVEEGWIEGDWTRTMPRLLNDFYRKFLSPPVNRRRPACRMLMREYNG